MTYSTDRHRDEGRTFDDMIVSTDSDAAVQHLTIFGVPRTSVTLLRRARLFAHLDADPAPALTIVRAGSGFGKTTLLADWVRNRSVAVGPTVWVTADDSTSDRLGFWREVLHGLDRVGLTEGTALGEVEVRGDVADLLPATIRRGFASFIRPVTVVVDGFERLAGTDVERDLIDLLTRTENLRLVIATQVSSQITDVTTAARLDTMLFDATVLRFDEEDVRRLAAQLQVSASRDELRRLHEELEGWPFGIRAVLERRRREASASLSEAQQAIFGVPSKTASPLDAGYTHRLLLASLEDLDGIDALLPTSILEAFTLEQASVVGASLDSHLILDELESRGLGTWNVDADPHEYRLHPALRRALKEKLARDPDAARAALTAIANWYVSRGDYARAFELAIEAEQWKLANRCVRSDLFEVLVRLRMNPDMLRSVPRQVLKQEPLLMLVDGVAHYGGGNQAKAVRTLLTAVAACEKQRLVNRKAPTPEQVWVQGILTIALRLTGRYELVPTALRRFTRMLDAVDDPDGHLDPAMLLFRTQTTITWSFLDRIDIAEQLAVNTTHEGRQRSQLQQANLHGLTAFTHARRGDLVRAERALRRIDEDGRPPQFDESFFAVTHHIAAAWIALEGFDVESAEQHLNGSERHWPTMEYWPFALEVHAHIEWQRNGAQSALLVLREGRAEKRLKASIGGAMNLLLTALEAELLLAAGHGSEAVSLMSPSRLRRSSRLVVPKCRSLLLAGNGEQAANLADRNALNDSVSWAHRVDLLLISASANLRMGDRAAAQDRFDRAFAIAENAGIRTPFAAMPRSDLRTLGADRNELVIQIEATPLRYPDPGENISLSRSEHRVLAELASDATLQEIARALSISPNTLKSQLRAVYRKLGVPGRQEAVRVARRKGLLLTATERRH